MNVSIGDSRRAFAAFGRGDLPTPAVVRRQHTVVASEIDPRFWHEGRQSRNEFHWIEGHLGRSIPVGRLLCGSDGSRLCGKRYAEPYPWPGDGQRTGTAERQENWKMSVQYSSPDTCPENY